MGGPLQHRDGFLFSDGLASETRPVMLVIFNNEQVTCVGAHVMGTSHDRKSDHALDLFYS
jgi:hypothetical protein